MREEGEEIGREEEPHKCERKREIEAKRGRERERKKEREKKGETTDTKLEMGDFAKTFSMTNK